jgi:hypothetical protein
MYKKSNFTDIPNAMLLRTYLPAIFLLSAMAFISCKKNKHTDAPPSNQEEELKIALQGVEEGAYNQALDSTFVFKIQVTSKLPQGGVSTKLNVVTDPAGIGNDQDPVANSSNALYDVTLKHLKELKTYKVTVTVTSLSNSGNAATPKIFYITNKKPL